MKTIRIIDLLNKIANGEIPKKIIYDGYVYQWNKNTRNYEREIDNDTTLNWDYITMNCLNEELEIIEDTPKGDKKLEKIDFEEIIKNREAGVSNDTYLACFINSIIGKINGE